MPSPIGHALGGLIAGLLIPGTREARLASTSVPSTSFVQRMSVLTRFAAQGPTPLAHLVICVGVACLPDLDFLWGRHNMETHSVGFAALVGFAVWGLRRSARLAAACVLAVASHVLFDWLGADTTPPLGVMALWPLTREFYFSDARIFQAISRRYWLPGFVQFNVLAVLREIVILLPIAGALWWWRSRGRASAV